MTWEDEPLIPTLAQLASGACEPLPKNVVSMATMYRMAPFQGALVVFLNNFVAPLIVTPTFPTGFSASSTSIAVEWLIFAAGQMAIGGWIIRRKRPPSILQIGRLTQMVEVDPGSANDVTRILARDRTFFKMARSIRKLSARVNAIAMRDALEDLDAALAA